MADSSVRRARDLGIPFTGTPGSFNAITDVAGLEVGYTTLVSGHGALKVGEGPTHTRVTAVLPRGRTGTKALTPLFEAAIDATGSNPERARRWRSDGRANRSHVPATSHSQVQDLLRAHNLLRT